MSFEQLLTDLEDLRKAQSFEDDGKGDKKIQAAAAEEQGKNQIAGDWPSDEDEDEDEEDKPGKDGAVDAYNGKFAKSMQVTTVDGEVIEAIDGTDLVKSLQDEIAAFRSGVAEDKESLAKSLGVVVSMLEEHGKLIKSMQERMDRVAGEGRGRKSVAAVDPSLAKSEPAPTGSDVLAKCETAFRAGKISGSDLAYAEAAVNRGLALPEQFVARL